MRSARLPILLSHCIYMFENKRMLASLSIGVALCTMPVSAQAQTEELDNGLRNLFAVAEANNVSLRSMKDNLKASEAAVQVARAARLPDVAGEASVSYLGDGRIWDRHFRHGAKAHIPHYGNNFALKAQQVVYSGGQISAGIALAQQQAEMSALSVEEQRQQVRLMLVGLYLQLHSLCNQRQVYQKNAELARKLIEQMRKRQEQGVTLRNDVTRYELHLQEVNLGIVTLEDEMDVAWRQLLTALGTDSISTELLPEQAFDDQSVSRESEAEWQQLALQHHADLRKTTLGIDMGETRERMERAAMRPKLALVAEDHLDGPVTIEVPPLNKNFNYWFVGIGVSYDFSSLYKAKRKVRQAQLATAVATDQCADTRQHVADGVHAAYVAVGTARTQLDTQLKNVQLASENYEVVSRRYESGLALVTDLTDAANVKLDAELALANARIAYIYSYYSLRHAAGVL